MLNIESGTIGDKICGFLDDADANAWVGLVAMFLGPVGAFIGGMEFGCYAKKKHWPDY